MKMYIGTSGYAYKEWKGKFYPDKISPREMLRFYAERLNSVEINNTFYQMPKTEQLTAWAEQVPDDFVFALKAPQVITHIKKMKNTESETERLFRALSILDEKLGPILFQFPKTFKADLPALKHFLHSIPGNSSCAFGFRSPSWHEEPILDLLRERGFSLCVEDTDEDPVKNIVSAASWGYVRLRRAEYTVNDLTAWKGMILGQKWERAFVFFKHEDEAKGAMHAIKFRDIMA